MRRIIFAIVIALLITVYTNEQQIDEISNGKSNNNNTFENESMTFEVKIPLNTNPEDSVYVYTHTQKKYKMEKTGNFTYRITLDKEELQPKMPNLEISYRYSRNGYDFHTAEYLEPDTNDYFWMEKGRTVEFERGKIQRDEVSRWRWFPENGSMSKETDLEPVGGFLPRINNEEFRSGQTIEELYVDAFYDFFNSTAKHMKQQGYNWVEIDPPQQLIEVDGLPKVSNDIEVNPNYPDDETFLAELRAYKKQDLKIMVAPQLCCNEINTKNRSKEWWSAYFNETEGFILHFAALAQQENVDAFAYAVPSWYYEDAPFDTRNEWKKIFVKVREVFDGEVGEIVWVLGPEVSPSASPIPDTEFITWADQLDFIMVASDFPLSIKDEPSDEELKQGAGSILDSTKVFYDEFKKPVIIRNAYFNVKYSWKGQTFYSINSIPWLADPEDALSKSIYEFNTTDHARTVNAQFQSIAERPWIIGYVHFGYTHWEDPLSPWMSIRGKQSEEIWRKWNKHIFNSSS